MLKEYRFTERCLLKDCVYYSSQKSQHQLPYPPEFLLVAHAFTGCDSTFGIYNKGKSCLHKLLTQGALLNLCKVFPKKNALHKEVDQAGTEIFSNLYGVPHNTTLNEFQYVQFYRLGSSVKVDWSLTMINLRSLCPTNGAAAQHCCRVYC